MSIMSRYSADPSPKITVLFILPIVVLSTIGILYSLIDMENGGMCTKCYKGMEIEIAAVVVAVSYLLVGFGKPYTFYVALACALVLLPGLVRRFMAKFMVEKSMTKIPEEPHEQVPEPQEQEPQKQIPEEPQKLV
jgi:hypothetical protein